MHPGARLALALSLLAPASAAQSVVFVDADASGADDGSSWDDAYPALQDGLAVAVPGGQVWVAEGTYRPDQGTAQTPGDRYASFALASGVELYGGFDGTEATLAARAGLFDTTVLSGDLAGDDLPGFVNTFENSLHVVDGSGTDAAALLDGFTVRGGRMDTASPDLGGAGLYVKSGGPTLRDVTFTANLAASGGSAFGYGLGGGMFNRNAAPLLVRCHFTGNEATNLSGRGGAIYNTGTADPVLVDCTFEDNRATGDAGVGPEGGAIYNQAGSTCVLSGCSFTGNQALSGPTGSAGNGGALANFGTLTLADSVFDGNVAGGGNENGYGGALYDRQNSGTTIRRCSFTNNTGGQGGAVLENFTGAVIEDCSFEGNTGNTGGALDAISSLPLTVTRCSFLDNTAALGGAVRSEDSDHVFRSCTFLGNTADVDLGPALGGAVHVQFGTPLFVDCLFSGNTAASTGGTPRGGAFSVSSGDVVLLGCSLTANVAGAPGQEGLGGGLHLAFSTSVLARNTILWGNVDHDAGGAPQTDLTAQVDGTSTLTTCCVQGLALPTSGNIGVNPQFVDADGADGLAGTADDDLRLSPGSPCIDAGDNAAVPADGADLDCDGDLGEPTPLDLGGLVRFVDDPVTPDTGSGGAPLVDMGAHEFGAPLPSDAWTDLGGGLAGSTGVPVLAGTGSLCPGTPFQIALTGTLPNTSAALILGVDVIYAPFKGGVLVPTPDILITGLPTGPAGAIVFGADWPTASAPGVSLWWQYWITDPAGPFGFAASNGLVGTTP